MGVYFDGDSVQLADDATAPPAVAGVDISGLKFGSGRRRARVRVRVKKSSGAGDVTLTGPVQIVVDDPEGAFLVSATLNGGADIVVGALGYSEVVEFATLGDLAELVPAAVAGGGYDCWLDPLAEDGF